MEETYTAAVWLNAGWHQDRETLSVLLVFGGRNPPVTTDYGAVMQIFDVHFHVGLNKLLNKQRVLMHGHQGWNVRHGLCHIYMIYVYIWVGYSFCLFCCLFIIVTTQFVALYKPSKPKPKPSTYDPPPPPPHPPHPPTPPTPTPPPPPPPHPPHPHPGQPPPGRDPNSDT